MSSAHDDTMRLLKMSSAQILPYDELKQEMTKFSNEFDSFVHMKRDQVMSERKEFIKEMTKQREEQNQILQGIDALKNSEKQLLSDIERDQKVNIEAKQAVTDLSSRIEDMKSQKAALECDLVNISLKITETRKDQALRETKLQEQFSLNAPELSFWEEYLALKISAPDADSIRITFTCIDDRDWEKEYHFELDLSTKDYKLTKCEPTVKDAQKYIDDLNSDRDFYKYLKIMRKAFKDALKPNI